MGRVYIDSLFCLNLAADYLLCLVSARVCGLYLRRLRYLGAALLGAIYSVCVFLPGLGFLMSPPGKLACLLMMGLAAFGGETRPFRCTLCFLAVSALFAGAVWGISMAAGLSSPALLYAPVSLKISFPAFALCYALCSLYLKRRGSARERQLLKIRLVHMGRECRFTALYDSGNTLTDPSGGLRVMPVSPRALLPLFGAESIIITEADPVSLVQKSEADPELRGRLRLVPYSSIGGSGLLAAFRADEVYVEGSRQSLLIAPSHRLSGTEYDAIY